ncbi:MAG: hypothetical protein NTZ74_13045, partial [Chloroflexi bacterium]|nr:hypothetical protein [Chloroflexota bacterium]
MSQFKYPFLYSEDVQNKIEGILELSEPLPYRHHSGGGGFYRTGQLSLSDGSGLEIVLYHNEATSKFIYLRRADLDKNVL